MEPLRARRPGSGQSETRTGLDFSPLSGFDPLNGDFQESALLREAAGIPAAGREIVNYGNLAL